MNNSFVLFHEFIFGNFQFHGQEGGDFPCDVLLFLGTLNELAGAK